MAAILKLKRLSKEELAERPWLFQTKYDEVETPIQLVQLMEEGFTNSMLYRELKISKSTFFQWMHDHPEFKQAYEYGKGLREASHDSIGIMNYDNPDFNAVAWQMIGRRYYGYTEYRSIKLPGLQDAKSFHEKTEVTLTALEQGEISPNEALIVSQVLSNMAKTVAETDILSRLEALEKINPQGGAK